MRLFQKLSITNFADQIMTEKGEKYIFNACFCFFFTPYFFFDSVLFCLMANIVLLHVGNLTLFELSLRRTKKLQKCMHFGSFLTENGGGRAISALM